MVNTISFREITKCGFPLTLNWAVNHSIEGVMFEGQDTGPHEVEWICDGISKKIRT